MTEHYECDKCGACCRHLILEAHIGDAMREPKLVQVCGLADGHGSIPLEQADTIILNRNDNIACAFLGDDNACTIYPTRPWMCVTMQAGNLQCQDARSSAGLEPLKPTGRAPVTQLEKLCAIARNEQDKERRERFGDEQ